MSALDLARLTHDRAYAQSHGFVLMCQVSTTTRPGKRIGGLAARHQWAIAAPLDADDIRIGFGAQLLRILCPDTGELYSAHIRRSLIAPRWPNRTLEKQQGRTLEQMR